ncbi:S41 family peptidase [Vibrio sp. WXL210]|uniref:S41 family peptidase n=1 Tax=Vibrio sp. WXL210 TaxID=3450709 RepID=UPI003EC6162C
MCNTVLLRSDGDLSVKDRVFGLSLFWKEASYNFAYFHQVPELDFDKAYCEYLTRAVEPQSTFQYYQLLMEFCALLKDGHTNIYMPPELENQFVDWPRIELEEVAGQAVVICVAEELIHLIPLGSVLTHIDGHEVMDYLQENILRYIAASSPHVRVDLAILRALHGKPCSSVKINFITPSGAHRQQLLQRNGRTYEGEHQSLKLQSVSGTAVTFERVSDDVAYVGLNRFDGPEIVDDFVSLLPQLEHLSGLVIDLRFNGGGDTRVAAEILSHLTDCELLGSKWYTRQHVAAYRSWGTILTEYQAYASDDAWVEGSSGPISPQGKGYPNLPIVILIGRHTASAAEDFLIYASAMQNVTTIGERTCGSTGQPVFGELPGGGCFRICAKRDTYPNGENFIGTGIEPDIYLDKTLEDVLNKVDTVKERALQILQEITSES